MANVKREEGVESMEPMTSSIQPEDADDALIGQLVAGTHDASQLLGSFADFEISQEGKADDAEDYEDFSDDELPEEETLEPASIEVPGLTDDTGTSGEADDLFGPSSPTDIPPRSSPPRHREDSQGLDLLEPSGFLSQNLGLALPDFPPSNQDLNIPSAPENVIELVQQAFPTFEKGVILNFNEQLAPQPWNQTSKKLQIQRMPKPLVPTKLSLEFETDTEKLFRIPGSAHATAQQRIIDAEAKGQVSCAKAQHVEETGWDIFTADADDTEMVGKYTLRDIELVCEDWDEAIDPPTPPMEAQPEVQVVDPDDDAWNQEFLEPHPKRRKIITEPGLPMIPRFDAPSFELFEEATSRAAKRVYLDYQDPYLLIDEEVDSQPQAKRPKLNHKQKRMANGRLGRDVSMRFNYANDQAYAQLKESHQSKIRAQHSSIHIDHSVPAVKLLWPYYRITRYGPEPHDYHRPQLQTGKGVGFRVNMTKPHIVKKKDRKSKRVPELFATSKDLSLNDNSTGVLFEYCEEMPTVLSNFGMGNKIINYYRLQGKEDEDRPAKSDLGEPQSLLPDDKSPFSIFGTVEPGETVPTLYNSMFRAPVFKHAARETDFVFGRSSTSRDAANYYLRKIDHLFVVGQNLPSLEVPGPHSRKVTSLSKNRLKMVAYRLLHQKGAVALSDITHHVMDSNDAQNRQKLKEFLSYDKDSRSWGLNKGEHLMDLGTINTMVKPEEVCLHDAMQVGQNELAQNGYSLDDSTALEDDDEDNEKDDLANSMVPWKTTKNFIDACSGKAMVQLHGAGDPTGRGLGFSFIKTSMKGGYMGAIQGPAATSADAIERERKANGGHSYNVKKQDALYNDAIRKIWGLQKASLQDETAHDDEDVQPQEDEDDRFNSKDAVATPVHVDDRMSQMSRPTSMSNAVEKRKLRITRKVRDPKSGTTIEKSEIVHDPGVIAQYMKHRAMLDMENIESVSF
jgi:transcription initiation factor TFIID subunit 1, fungi type